jgi:hypothetical protein
VEGQRNGGGANASTPTTTTTAAKRSRQAATGIYYIFPYSKIIKISMIHGNVKINKIFNF